MKTNVKLIEPNAGNLKNLPVFYNYIYYNPILDRGKEDVMIKFSKRKCGVLTYSESDKFISKVIDFEQLPQTIFEHESTK